MLLLEISPSPSSSRYSKISLRRLSLCSLQIACEELVSEIYTLTEALYRLCLLRLLSLPIGAL